MNGMFVHWEHDVDTSSAQISHLTRHDRGGDAPRILALGKCSRVAQDVDRLFKRALHERRQVASIDPVTIEGHERTMTTYGIDNEHQVITDCP